MIINDIIIIIIFTVIYEVGAVSFLFLFLSMRQFLLENKWQQVSLNSNALHCKVPDFNYAVIRLVFIDCWLNLKAYQPV